MIWKPSLKTPLTAIAVQHIANRVMENNGLEGLFNLVIGEDAGVGEAMLADRRLPLISATGSCRMGKRVSTVVGERLGRSLLELGGNNAIIVMDDADLDLAVSGVLFGAVGTAGQRCTSTRRVFLQKGIAGAFIDKLLAGYKQIRVGDPLDENTLMGPLIDGDAIEGMMASLRAVAEQGGELLCGGNRIDRPGFFVEPTVVKANPDMAIVQDETFAPILYVFEVDDVEEALKIHNDVPQGLSSAIFTDQPARRDVPLAPRAATAGSPTSTSAPPAPRSAAPSAARRRPAAAASPAPTPGRPTCGARPTRSTGPRSSRWPRASSSTSRPGRPAEKCRRRQIPGNPGPVPVVFQSGSRERATSGAFRLPGGADAWSFVVVPWV